MKAEFYSGCYSTSIRIDGKPIDDLPKEELIKIWTEIADKVSDERYIVEQIGKMIDQFGIQSDIKICDQCGGWNYSCELNI